MTVSFYNCTTDKNFTVTSADGVMQSIITGQWAETINYLRTLNKDEYKAEKKRIVPAVTWSGVFEPGTRSIESLKAYSGLVVLDLDGIDVTLLDPLKSQLATDPYVRYCFTSPSGVGLKIVVQVDTLGKDHRAAWLHLVDVFEKKYLVKFDVSGKDVSRLCYVSFDPTAIFNQKNEVFKVDLKYGEIITQHTPQTSTMQITHDYKRTWAVTTKWLENGKSKFKFEEGQRNIYIHAMACALNRCGVDINTTIQLISENLPTPDTKWHQSVRSAYFHNQFEHNTVQIRDMGTTEFVAPAYMMDNVQDLAARDLMTITAMLHTFKVPYNFQLDIVTKIGNFYQTQGFIDLSGGYIHTLMGEAMKVMQSNVQQQNVQNALITTSAEDMGEAIFSSNSHEALPVYLPPFDNALRGGIMPGNTYGLIGFGRTYKSVLIQYMAYMDAVNDIPSLYINGEMSKYQFFERQVLLATGHRLKDLIDSGSITKETLPGFTQYIKEITKGNMQVYNGIGFKKENIIATCSQYFNSTGKRIKRVYIDGLAQFDWGGREEVGANIYNSFVVKELAKELNDSAGAAVMSLIHCSGTQDFTIRNTGGIVRGGSKMLANFDGYFCTSLYVEPQSAMNATQDLQFIPNKFNLLLQDKRSDAPQTSAVINVMSNLHLEVEPTDPKFYEISKQQQGQW